MKKLFLAVAALAMLATSCTKDDTAPAAGAGESLVSFEVSAPVIGTRANAYDIYGIGEAVEHLHYAVYLTEGTEDAPVYKLVFTNCIEDAFAGDALSNTSLELKLVNDQTYTAIFWADAPGAPYTFDAATKTVTLDPSALAAQDENLDAFFGHHKFLVAGPKVERVVLNRPFAQLNIATADIAEAAAAGVVVDAETTTKVQVSGLYTTLNLLSEEVGGEMTELTVYNAAPKAEGQIDGTYEMLSMNYLFVQKSRKLVDVTFDVETEAGQKVNRLFQQVPVERNYRTNILGNLFVDNIGFEIVINPIFDGVIPTTEAEKLRMATIVDHEYTLNEDVVLGDANFPYLEIFRPFTLNGAGHKLTSGNAGNYCIIVNGEDAKLTVNNTNVTSNGGAVAATNGAEVVFNSGKVYVDSPSTSGRYLFYADGAGSTITINGGEFSWDPADNQKRAYICAMLGTTVYVKGGTFGKASTRDGYKAGILGEGTVVITGGTFGFNPSAWLAEGYYANKVGNNWVVSDELHVNTAEALAAELTSNKENIKVKLTADIDVAITSLGQQTGGSGEYKLGGENTKVISIDLGGKKLNITTTYWSGLGAKNANATFTIKNGTMTSSQPTGTWNSYDVTFANCNYVIEDVVFDKAVAFTNAGKSVVLNDVTINETHDYYAMWISAKGQNVTIDGLTVNAAAGRGIKIDEQYVDAPAKVTLNVANATFNTAKKAAIVVKSVAGAEINASNLNIANVAADSEFAVWVDEDAAAHADKVVVNGAYVKVEGQEAAVVSTAAELTAALANAADGATIVLNDGTYEGFFSLEGKNVKLVANGQNAVINGVVWANNTTAELKGLTLTNAAGAKHPNPTNSKYYNEINDKYPCVGAYLNSNITMTECTFNLVGPTVYGFYGYAENNPVFEGCVFNCNKIRPIASNGDEITVNGCTFNNQYHYAVRIFENSGETQTVVFTNNVMQGANDKGEFEGINISKKGNTATVVADFTITGNSVAKYRHHNKVTMSDACTYNTDITHFAFEREE